MNVFHFRSSGSAGNNVMSDTRNKISLFEKAAREQRAEAPERQRQVRTWIFFKKKDTLGKLIVYHLQRAKFEARKSKFEQPQEQQQQEQQGKKQQNGG